MTLHFSDSHGSAVMVDDDGHDYATLVSHGRVCQLSLVTGELTPGQAWEVACALAKWRIWRRRRDQGHQRPKPTEPPQVGLGRGPCDTCGDDVACQVAWEHGTGIALARWCTNDICLAAGHAKAGVDR